MGKSLSMSARPGRARAVPGAAFAVSVVCLLGQLGSLAHEATARHVRCAEHGELSHVDSKTVSPDSLAVERAGAGPWSVADQAVTEGPTHEHCAFVFSRRWESSKPILLVAPAPEPATPPEPRAAPILAAPTERILLSAPKIAPPVRTAAC